MGGLDILVSNVSAMTGPDWGASVNVELVRTDELILVTSPPRAGSGTGRAKSEGGSEGPR